MLNGVAADQPSWLTDSTMSAPVCGTASASSWCTGSPSHTALPARSPPTSLDMQVNVVRCSVSGRASSSAYVRVTGVATIPVTFSVHASGSIAGSCSAVSIR